MELVGPVRLRARHLEAVMTAPKTPCPFCARPLFAVSPVGCDHYPAMERLALCVESGVPERRAVEIAVKEVKP